MSALADKCKEVLRDLDSYERLLERDLEYVYTARRRALEILRGQGGEDEATELLERVHAYLASERDVN